MRRGFFYILGKGPGFVTFTEPYYSPIQPVTLSVISPPVNALLQMHQDAFDQVSEGVLWVDESGQVHYGNESAATLLGYTRNALTRTSYFEINPHFSRMGWRKFWNRLQDNVRERLDTEFINSDGKLFSVRGAISFDIFSIDPELCLVVFQATEVGKREADLLEAIQRHAQIGSWEVNLTTKQIYLSTLLREWLDLPADRTFYTGPDLLPLLQKLIVSDQYERIRGVYKQLRARNDEVELPLQLKIPSTDELTAPNNYLIRAQSVENELEVFKIYGTVVVVDGEKAMRVRQPLSQEILARALDKQSEAVYAIGFADRKINYLNDRACEISGYNRNALVGSAASKLSPPDQAEELASVYEKVREKKYFQLAHQLRRQDGSLTAVHSRFYYYEYDGEAFLIVIARDHDQQLPASENLSLYATTLDALHEWVIWLNLDGEVVLLNEAARRKLRRKTSRDIEGMRIDELLPDLEVPGLADIRQEQLDGRTRSAIDYVYSNPSGEDRTLQIRFVQVAAGSQFFLSLICRDVTIPYINKRRLQEAKRRVDELTRQLQSENENLREQIEQVNTSGSIITVSEAYRRVLGQIAQVADTDATVLVTGETGTGKELLAQSIHKFSSRGKKSLVSVNCAALPENLIESELFGHERGAFTGAFARKKGKFELADTSTIFLDEIGELPLDMQAKLLRVLQEGEIQRIGSTESINVDVRIVAATNRDLEDMITRGTFREDLFYRLNVFPIHNMPLRERPEDIPILVKHFTKVYAERMGRNITHINPRDLEKLSSYEFPGNVRELINLVERAVITSNSSTLNLSASLRALRRPDRSNDSVSFRNDKIVPFEIMQKEYIIEALRRTGGKVTGPGGAAELLDINGRTLMSKMNKMGIDRNKFTG